MEVVSGVYTSHGLLHIQNAIEPKQNLYFYYIAKAVITQKITTFYFLKQTAS